MTLSIGGYSRPAYGAKLPEKKKTVSGVLTEGHLSSKRRPEEGVSEESSVVP